MNYRVFYWKLKFFHFYKGAPFPDPQTSMVFRQNLGGGGKINWAPPPTTESVENFPMHFKHNFFCLKNFKDFFSLEVPTQKKFFKKTWSKMA